MISPLQTSVYIVIAALLGDACYLPDGMVEYPDLWYTSLALPKMSGLVGCLHRIHDALRNVCLRLHAQPAVQQLIRRPYLQSISNSAWRIAIVTWVGEQRGLLEGFADQVECVAWRSRLLISPEFLSGLSGQFAALALDAMHLGSEEKSRARDGSRWVFRFQSLWTQATQYAMYLQHLTLGGFESLNDLSYRLHRGEWRRRNMNDSGGRRFTLREEGKIFDAIAKNTPSFRLEGEGWVGLNANSLTDEFESVPMNLSHRIVSRFGGSDSNALDSRHHRRGSPLLKHDSTSGDAVHAVVRNLARRGRRLRLVEVGVFRANLSGHVWDRMVHEPGSLEMHLVDHWGFSSQPMWRPPWLQNEFQFSRTRGMRSGSLGTGSDMGGQSNETTMLNVWLRFARRGARCVEVPHWLSNLPGAHKPSLQHRSGSRADIFFHRTTTVNAARIFGDSSLDFVYIDADHKWWSVLQDLAIWWPKVKPGGILMGHDFHLNPLMEREGDPRGDSNDVPMAIAAFFRSPTVITLHTGFTWSVMKALDANDLAANLGSATPVVAAEICAFLRQRLSPQYDFEICSANGTTI